jgi:tRNA A37 threonylcarbamoyltransferase TsaD
LSLVAIASSVSLKRRLALTPPAITRRFMPVFRNARRHLLVKVSTTDNGAMIAYAGCQRLLVGERDDLAIRPMPRWPLETLTSVTDGS